MKKLFSVLVFLSVFGNISLSAQITITQWNFNGDTSTAVPGGILSPLPSIGVGTASLIGGITGSFNSGIVSGGSSDTIKTVPPNYSWNTTNYAAASTENKQRGVQFNVSTLGYSGIKFTFDQKLSNTASNTYVLQYTANGTDWVDAATFTFTPADTTADKWYNRRTADLSAISALNNNANAAFRIMSAFDPVKGDYTSANSTKSYSTNGTSRFDMVTVTGTITSDVKYIATGDDLKLFPNPASSVVNLSKPVNYTIIDLNGKIILTGSEKNTIDISSIKSGIYILKTDTGEVRKLIRQ